MSRFASEKRALGICDRCGLTYKLKLLKAEYVKGRPQGNRVCPDCHDPDHPQNFFGSVVPLDPEALQNPRPDTANGRLPDDQVIFPPVMP